MGFMSFLLKKVLMGFFVSVTCICAVMAVLRLIFEQNARFGYEAFFFPLIYGALGALSSLVLYTNKELSFKRALLRRIIRFILGEAVILLVLYSGGALKNLGVTVSVAASIVFVGFTVQLVVWLNDRRTAKNFNAALKEMQQKYEIGSIKARNHS